MCWGLCRTSDRGFAKIIEFAALKLDSNAGLADGGISNQYNLALQGTTSRCHLIYLCNLQCSWCKCHAFCAVRLAGHLSIVQCIYERCKSVLCKVPDSPPYSRRISSPAQFRSPINQAIAVFLILKFVRYGRKRRVLGQTRQCEGDHC